MQWLASALSVVINSSSLKRHWLNKSNTMHSHLHNSCTILP